MPVQSLIFTALPNGMAKDGKLRLSVLVSPRLDPEASPKSLLAFTNFHEWPKTIAAAEFTVQLGTKKVILTSADFDTTLGAPDGTAWKALFPTATYVRPFSMRDHSDDTVVSYDTTAIHSLVAGFYGKLAAEATDELPAVGDLLADEKIATLVDAVKDIDDRFWDKETRGPDGAAMLNKLRDKWKSLVVPELAAFQLFHMPSSKPKKQAVARTDDPRIKASWRTYEETKLDATKAVAELDFHQIVAAMNQYPTLLRRLGLVIDFAIAPTAFTAGADLPLTVSVEIEPPKFQPSDAGMRVVPRVASPATRTRLSTKAFDAVSRPSLDADDMRVTEGLLALDDKHFALLQADVDGAGHKLTNLLRSLGTHGRGAQPLDPVTKLPRRIGAPALRNAGLMLVQKNRGEGLTRKFVRNKALDQLMQQLFTRTALPSAPGLYAEDLVRGYRVDIWDKNTEAWRSLCERVASYDIAKGAVKVDVREEGTVRLGATSSSIVGYNPDVLYLHETVTVWNGWSLVAQQPGQTVAVHPDQAKTPDETVRNSAADVPDGIRLRTSFIASPGSLPRLRYGHVYGVRARIVDLAGNSLPPSTKSYAGDDKSITGAKPYLRFEPVQPPTIALVGTRDKDKPNLPLEGESMMRIAVRSLNERYDDPTPTTQIGLRWGVAPRVSQRDAELHGALDGPEWGTPAQHALLVDRDSDLKHVDVDITPVQTGDKSTSVKYAVLPIGATQLPYLPDPLCTHIVPRLRNYPYASPPLAIEIPLYPNGAKWPNAAPFYIQVYEAAGDLPNWNESKRTLFIPLPKATRATLRLSAKLSPEALDLMGVWNWIPASKRTAALERAAKNGGLWPLTPWREVDVVHAVQRPLLSPKINTLYVERSAGATTVTPSVDTDCHCASTDRVDLHAAWHDPRDVDGSASPRDEAKTDVPFAVKVTDPIGYGGNVEHLLPDPANPNRIIFGPNTLDKEKQDTLIGKVHDFGDTRYRRVAYHLVATSRFREYMPKDPPKDALPTRLATPSLRTEAKTSVIGAPQATWALNASPPPAPEVLYVVPTFAWTRETGADGKQTSKRKGHGLRVWLGRPWNATGYGEMLGVILPQTNSTVDPNDPPYKNTVTQWGNDPIWKAPFVAGAAPSVHGFPRARIGPDATGAWLPPGAPADEALQPFEHFTTRSIPHPGLPQDVASARVDVVPHDVFWDGERRLWYCDIEFPATSAYFPFVRMAVARYQPSSLPNCHLSTIVLTDFATIAPNRSVTVTRTSATRRQVQVFGISHDESSGYREAEDWRKAQIPLVKDIPSGISQTNVIDVWVEKLTVSQGEDFGWHRVDDGGWSAAGEGAPGVFRAVDAKPAAAKAKLTVKSAAAKPVLSKATVAKFEATPQPTDPPVAELAALWTGTVDVPSEAGRYRLVIAEYEEYLVDDSTPYNARADRKGRRLVFVEHIPL